MNQILISFTPHELGVATVVNIIIQGKLFLMHFGGNICWNVPLNL